MEFYGVKSGSDLRGLAGNTAKCLGVLTGSRVARDKAPVLEILVPWIAKVSESFPTRRLRVREKVARS